MDTLALATRLLPGLRKPTPNVGTAAWGVRTVEDATPRRPGCCADRYGRRCAARTCPGCRFSVSRGSEVDRSPGYATAAGAHGARELGRGSIDSGDNPRAPGVYLMRDANERVIYVGKAKNLRDRVGTYFSQPLGYTRKMDGLIESLSRIQVEVVGSELEALLLESQLIRRYQPRYNTALRSHEQYPFIRIDVANPWPRVSLAKSRKDDGARYFGPFRSAATARKTVDLINRVVPLRTCARSFRDARSYGSPCLQLDLGRCLGPCGAGGSGSVRCVGAARR